MSETVENWFVTPNGDLVTTITRITSLDPETSARLTGHAGNAILAGLLSHTSPEKIQNLYNLLKTEHVNEQYATHPEKVLDHQTHHLLVHGKQLLDPVFGTQKDEVARQVAQQAGVPVEAAQSALEATAPLALAQLKHKVNTEGLDAPALASFLNREGFIDRVRDNRILGALGLGGLAAGLGAAAGQLGDHGKDLAGKATDALGGAKDAALQGGAGLFNKAAGTANAATDRAREAFHKASHTLDEAGDKAQDTVNRAASHVSDAASKVGDKASDAADKISDAAGKMGDKASDAAHAGMDKARDLAGDAKDHGKAALNRAEEAARDLEAKAKGKWIWIAAAIAVVVLLIWLLKACENSKAQKDAASTSSTASTSTTGDGSSTAGDSTTSATTGTGSTTGSSSASGTGTSAPDQFEYTWKDGKLNLDGSVGNQDSKNAIVNAATSAFGADKVVDNITVNSASPTVDSGSADKMTTWLKDYPGLTVKFDGKTATVSGTVKSEADKTNAVDSLKSTLGSGYTVNDDITVDSSDANATDSSTKAPASAGGKVVLDVDFAPGSATVQSKYDGEISSFAKQLTDSGASGTVAGYTDNVGGTNYNMRLSQARANAVKNALVKDGVASDKLTAKGYGDADPIASNDTADGRAQNRRVVFIRNS